MLYLGTWATIGQWRGLWYILDRYMDVHWQSNMLTFTVTLILLWAFKASVNILAPPFAASYDMRDDVFITTPRLRTEVSRYPVVDRVKSMTTRLAVTDVSSIVQRRRLYRAVTSTTYRAERFSSLELTDLD